MHQKPAPANLSDPLQPRKMALSVLHQAQRGEEDIDIILERELSATKLESRDRAFVMLLVMTVLRRMALVDALLAKFMKKPIDASKAAYVQDVLRLGAVQLLWLDSPPHAAVHTSVELIKRSKFRGFEKLVNAVLQSIVREGKAKLATLDVARITTPDWLWQSWRKAYGEETARRIAEANQTEPGLTVTLKSPAETAFWQEALNASALPTGSLRVQAGGLVSELPGYREGAWWVQDVAAAIPALLFGSLKDKTVLDLCAAPGGKTAQLAVAGGNVTALDRSKNRLQRVQENLTRLSLQAKLVAADMMQWEPDGQFDAILLDAPCTATGTLRRHPDIARDKSAKDVMELADLQRKMLLRAGAWLKPGGMLVYCSCSLETEEGEAHIEPVLAAMPDLKLVPIRPEEVGGLDEIVTAQGYLRALPFYREAEGGMDGFFAVRFTKSR